MPLESSFTIALLLVQILSPDAVATPSTINEQRANIALISAQDGRELARRFICSNEERYTRLREREEKFSQLKFRFLRYFGHEWHSSTDSDTLAGRSNDLGRRDDCKIRDSFEAGLSEYDNGLIAADTQLNSNDSESNSY